MNAEDLATYQALRDLDMKLYANSRRMARERARRQKQGLSVVDPTGPDAYLALAEDMGLLPVRAACWRKRLRSSPVLRPVIVLA